MKNLAELSDNGQKQALANVKENYNVLITRVQFEILKMQRFTQLIASYVDATVDFPDGKDAKTSAPCFNESFDRIQATIDHLDNEIIRAKALEKLSLSLKQGTASKEKSLLGSSPSAPGISEKKQKETEQTIMARSRNQSDITETKKNRPPK